MTRPRSPAVLSSLVRFTCAAISRLCGGRFADNHDELLYVIRKPLDRFARVVLPAAVPLLPSPGELSSSMHISGAANGPRGSNT